MATAIIIAGIAMPARNQYDGARLLRSDIMMIFLPASGGLPAYSVPHRKHRALLTQILPPQGEVYKGPRGRLAMANAGSPIHRSPAVEPSRPPGSVDLSSRFFSTAVFTIFVRGWALQLGLSTKVPIVLLAMRVTLVLASPKDSVLRPKRILSARGSDEKLFSDALPATDHIHRFMFH